jgi:hypothetical protein
MASSPPSPHPFSPNSQVKASPTIVLHHAPAISLKGQPSIILHTAPITISTAPFVPANSSSSDPISKSAAQITETYRYRYAAYLSALFNISLEAAFTESDYQLTPRRASDVSEADVHRTFT